MLDGDVEESGEQHFDLGAAGPGPAGQDVHGVRIDHLGEVGAEVAAAVVVALSGRLPVVDGRAGAVVLPNANVVGDDGPVTARLDQGCRLVESGPVQVGVSGHGAADVDGAHWSLPSVSARSPCSQ